MLLLSIARVMKRSTARSLKDILKRTDAKNWPIILDIANYRVVAHAIKSTSRTIGAIELSDLAKELEYAAADGNIEFIREKNDSLAAMYSDILDKIKAAL